MSETLNIAHCIHGLGLGGAQRIVKALVPIRHQQPSDCYVYCSLSGPVRREVEEVGATVRILPRYFPKFDPSWVFRLARAFERDRIHLVHTHLFGDSLHGCLAARLAGDLPVVMTIHNELESFSRLQQRGYRWLLPRCTRTIACSDSARHSFEITGWPGSERIQTIPNGIPEPRPRAPAEEVRRRLLEESGVELHRPLLATIGRLAPEKGHRFLIRALARLASAVSTPPLLLFVGVGPLREALAQQARAEGVEHLTRFLGFRSDIAEILPAIDVVVFSSLHEGLPLALLEAMATERCIVGTAIPGILNAVRAGREALLVTPRSADELAEALGRVLSDPGLRRRLGQNARRHFLARFTADRMVESYAAVQREVLGATRAA